MRIGLNVHGQNVPDQSRLLDYLKATRPAWVLIMDNLGLARDIQGALPDTNVIYRHWAPDGDDNDALQYTPEAWVAERKKMIGDSGLWAYTTNEPAFDAYTIDWHVRVVELAHKAGLKLVVGNWSVGKPADVDHAWGMADKLLRLLDAYRDTMVLGLHEYACGVITSGFIGGSPQDQMLIYPEFWPRDAANLTKWHCGRFNFVVRHCQNTGIRPPRIILTEHGFDDVSDIKPWTETLKKTPVTGNPGGNIRGWKTLATQWHEWFSNWSTEQAYFEQLKYADQKLYQGSAVEAQLIFSWGHSSPIWYQFDVAEARELQNLLIGYASVVDAPPSAPLPEPSPVVDAPVVDAPAHPGIPTTLSNTSDFRRYIRAKAGTDQRILDVIPPGKQFVAYLDTVALADDLRWTWVTVSGVNGWTANVSEWTNGQAAPDTDAPDDVPDSETLARILLELEILKARVVALESRNEALVTVLAGVGQLFVNVNGKES